MTTPTSPPFSDPLLGTRIREYEILEVLGKGGMGAVYRARHIYLEEERAIKVIHTNLALDKDFVDRFIREAKTLSRLHHPNLVQLHEFGTVSENVFFMVLEFLKGETASERLHRIKKMPVDQAIKIVREAALGLQSAHQKGVIHRDISPDNLFLVKEDAEVEITKVIDFGIAKPNMESSQHFTATGLFMGKLEFCSPEQCGMLDEGERIDQRTDIYSLGITLYYLIAGKLPFHSPTPQGYIFKHIAETPNPVSVHLGPEDAFPKALDAVILKALSKRREDRYLTMYEFVKGLDNVSLSTLTTSEESRVDAVHPTEDPQEGRIFANRYLIEKRLGEGGFGAVFRAVDQMLNVTVALKVMTHQILADESTLERFKREVIIARQVSHSNICRIYDMGQSGSSLYVSMELLDGQTLAELIQDQGRLKLREGVLVIKQILAALNEMHRLGIIHRDLKPQNIMIAGKGATIMDFGISISDNVRHITRTGMIVGTAQYMSPEQLQGRNIDHRSDLYSVGLIMFKAFTGSLPYHGNSALEIINASLLEIPKPSGLVQDFPSELEEIILTSLHRDVQKRYQNAGDLLKALEQFEANFKITDEQSENAQTRKESILDSIGDLPTEESRRSRLTIGPGADTKPTDEADKKMDLLSASAAKPAGFSDLAKVESSQVPTPSGDLDSSKRVRSNRIFAGISGVLLVLIAIYFIRNGLDKTPEPTAPSEMAGVVINALPWANITVISVENNKAISISDEERITPCSLLLWPGQYKVELKGADPSQVLQQTIHVTAGKINSFEFKMPAFDPDKIAKESETFE